MPSHWGLGMLINNGDCLDCDYGDNADRVMFATKLWGHFIAFMWDWVATGPTTQIIGPQTGTGRLLQRRHARRRLAVDPRARQAGQARGAQREARPGQGSSSTTAATSSTASRTGIRPARCSRRATPMQSLQNGIHPRQAKAFIGDIWLRLNWKKLHIESEGAIIAGTIGNLSDIYARGARARRQSCPAASSSRPTTSSCTTRSRSSSRSATPRATTPKIRTPTSTSSLANLVPVEQRDPPLHASIPTITST